MHITIQRKPLKAEAVQFTGDNLSEVLEFCGNLYDVMPAVMPGTYFLTDSENGYLARLVGFRTFEYFEQGYYFFRDDGELKIIDYDTFHRLYEEVSL